MSTTASGSPRFDLGGCVVTLLSGGAFKLDGGAMFGIVPKPLWTRAAPADERNRIPLACNCLLVEWERPGRRAIIETGHGPKYAAKEREIFDIDPSRWLLPALRAAAVDPATITDVVVTHLHFDHAGGLTHEVDGRLRPTFPNAKVYVQRREFEDARANFGIMTATYREANFAPLDQAGAWRLLDGEQPILDGLRPLLTPGHTRGHQSLLIQGRDRTAVFSGDVMPTAAHVGAAWNMAYDLFPLDNRASKNKLLRQAADERWLIVIDHEPRRPVVMAAIDGDWYKLLNATS